MFTFKQLYQAYVDCRKNKRGKPNVLKFELNQEEFLLRLLTELNDRSYRPTTSVCFYIDRPKPREIFAADFKDRIVHHLIYTRLERKWEGVFIDQSFACRNGKGIHKAVDVLQVYLRKVTRNGKKPAYYLKMDIKNFFMSINKQVLFQLLWKKSLSKDLRWLVKTVIFHDPTRNYHMHSPKRMQEKVPQQKSLFHVLEDCGLPIGNLTSQFFANVYLNALDQFVKHTLKCKFYLRYVDDFILLSEDETELLRWQQQIKDFLQRQLLLAVNERVTRIDRVFNGVDFVGYIVRPFYRLCRRKVIGSCREKLRKFCDLLVTDDERKITWRYDSKILEQLMATVNSYLGHFSHANTKKVVLKLLKDYYFIAHYFRFQEGRLVRKYKYRYKGTGLKSQVGYFNWLFKDSLVLNQVGCYYESYGKNAELLHALLGYQLKNYWRHFQKACGFKMDLLDHVVKKLDERKTSYTIINQTGRQLRRVMERQPAFSVRYKSRADGKD